MKLQLKRSNVLENGAAKKPGADQLDYGELAVNYNSSDPRIFLKDSANTVVEVGSNLDNGGTVTGNLVVTGNVTAAYLYGDGQNITGIAQTLQDVTSNGSTTTNGITSTGTITGDTVTATVFNIDSLTPLP